MWTARLAAEEEISLAAITSPSCGRLVAVSVGEELLEERRRRRRAGDPRLSAEGREILRRVTRGDLQPEFQAALDADLAADEALGGGHPDLAG